MKRQGLTGGLICLLAISPASIVFAQTGTLSDWSVVEKIETDEQLVVKQRNEKEIKGKMIEATPTALTIDRNGKQQTIARAEIREIPVIARKADKAKWALIGAGVGAGAGAGIGATKYSSDSDDSEIYRDGSALRNWYWRGQWTCLRSKSAQPRTGVRCLLNSAPHTTIGLSISVLRPTAHTSPPRI